MKKEYLLDTNAYFNILKAIVIPELQNQYSEQISTIKQGDILISTITKIEIISVLGKYARGISGGFLKCNGIISEEGDICTHSKYVQPRKQWNNRRVKYWLKLLDDLHQGKSNIMTVSILPFNEQTIKTAQSIIIHSLKNNFGSMDAMIAATAECERNRERDIIVITSDKALKQCLNKCGIPIWDPFSSST